MPISAILMAIIAAVILYGGIIICLRIAIKKREPVDRGDRPSR